MTDTLLTIIKKQPEKQHASKQITENSIAQQNKKNAEREKNKRKRDSATDPTREECENGERQAELKKKKAESSKRGKEKWKLIYLQQEKDIRKLQCENGILIQTMEKLGGILPLCKVNSLEKMLNEIETIGPVSSLGQPQIENRPGRTIRSKAVVQERELELRRLQFVNDNLLEKIEKLNEILEEHNAKEADIIMNWMQAMLDDPAAWLEQSRTLEIVNSKESNPASDIETISAETSPTLASEESVDSRETINISLLEQSNNSLIQKIQHQPNFSHSLFQSNLYSEPGASTTSCTFESKEDMSFAEWCLVKSQTEMSILPGQQSLFADNLYYDLSDFGLTDELAVVPQDLPRYEM